MMTSRRPSTFRRWLLPVATFLTLAIVALVYFQGLGGSAIRLPKPDLGMPFLLASSKGGMVESRSLRGKPYAMFFGFTHCPEVCPTTIYEMSSSLERLGAQAEGFRIFFVTVDPERDTTESLRDYLSNFDPRIEGLVPTVEQLPKLASAYRIYFAKIATSDGGYTMDHSALVYLFDGDGHYADMIPYGAPAETRDRKLRELLAAPPA
jgi:protein SCO1/2